MWGVTQVTCIASVSAFDCTSFGFSAVSSSCISVTAFPAASSCVSPLSYRLRTSSISLRLRASSVRNVWISSRYAVGVTYT